MKRFAIALVLLFLAITLSISCQFALSRTIRELHAQVELVLALTTSGEREELVAQTGQLMGLWQKNTGLLHMLVMHRAMEEVEMHILLLPDQLEDTHTANFRESCEIVKCQLENLRDSARVSLRNIF